MDLVTSSLQLFQQPPTATDAIFIIKTAAAAAAAATGVVTMWGPYDTIKRNNLTFGPPYIAALEQYSTNKQNQLIDSDTTVT